MEIVFAYFWDVMVLGNPIDFWSIVGSALITSTAFVKNEDEANSSSSEN